MQTFSLRTVALGIALCAASTLSWAQESKEALAKRYLDAQQPMFEMIMDAVNKDFKSRIAAEQDPNKRRFMEAIAKQGVLNDEDIDQIKMMVAQSVATKLTEEELKEIVAFSERPVAKKLLALSKDIEAAMAGTMLQILGRKIQNMNPEDLR